MEAPFPEKSLDAWGNSPGYRQEGTRRAFFGRERVEGHVACAWRSRGGGPDDLMSIGAPPPQDGVNLGYAGSASAFHVDIRRRGATLGGHGKMDPVVIVFKARIYNRRTSRLRFFK